MDALMAHHASKAFFVAAYAAHYLLRMITNHLVGPGGVGDQLTAHRRAIDPALSQLLFHKIRSGQAAYAAYGQTGILAHQIAIRQETAFPAKIRVRGRGNGVFQR